MLEKPPADRFLIDVVMNRGIVEHHDRRQTGFAFLRAAQTRPSEIRLLDTLRYEIATIEPHCAWGPGVVGRHLVVSVRMRRTEIKFMIKTGGACRLLRRAGSCRQPKLRC
jgi:hypothetical protein